ncbi:MAG: NADH-quinone oxidoreductase subunit J [Bacteroidales bacterium]
MTEINSYPIVFFLLAAVAVVFSILAVTTKKILRAATYLLFVLFASAGFYFLLHYSFLGAVQLTIYVGGIIVLYVFSILLTNTEEEKKAPLRSVRRWLGCLASIAGACLIIYLFMTNLWSTLPPIPQGEIDMKTIGYALMGTEKYQYILPFELISVLLLACIVGGIMIARKRK